MNPQLESQIALVAETVTKIVLALSSFLVSLPLLGGAITAVVATIGGFGLALRSATAEASALARSLSAMRAANGFSYSQGYDIQRRFGAIGVSQSDTTRLFSQPGNSAVGFALRGVNPRDLAGIASQYQQTANSGIFGRQIANSRLNSQFGGSVPDSLREAVSNLSPNQIRGAQNYSDRINSALGIDANRLKEFSTALPLLEARISSVVSAVKIRLGTELLPLIENVLGKVADYLANNADKIAAAVKRFATWIVFELPISILRGVAAAAGAFSLFLQGVAAFTKGLIQYVPAFLAITDGFINAMRRLGAVIVGIGAVISQALQNLGIIPPQGVAPSNATSSSANQASIAPNPNAAATAARVKAAVKPAVAPDNDRMGGWAKVAAWTAGGAAGGAGVGALAAGIPTLGIGTLAGAGIGAAWGGGLGFLAGVASYAGDYLHYLGKPGAVVGGPHAAARTKATTDAVTGAAARAVRGAIAPNASFVPGAMLPANGSLVNAFMNGSTGFLNSFGSDSNMAKDPERIKKLTDFLNGTSNNAQGGADFLTKIQKGADGMADSWQAEMVKTLAEIQKNTSDTADNTDKRSNQDLAKMIGNIVLAYGSRVMADIATDSALNVLHI